MGRSIGLILLALWLAWQPLRAQEQGGVDSSTVISIVDSLMERMRLEQSAAQAAQEELDPRRIQASDTSFIAHFEKIEQFAVELYKLDRLLNLSFDTLSIRKEIEGIDEDVELVHSIYETFPDHLNFAALDGIHVALQQMENYLTDDQALIVESYNELLQSRQKLVTLEYEIESFEDVPDSLLQVVYGGQLAGLQEKWESVTDAQNQRIMQLMFYQNLITSRYIRVENLINQTERLLGSYAERLSKPEFPILWRTQAGDYLFQSRPSFGRSLKRAQHVVRLYFRSHWPGAGLVLLAILGFYAWIRTNLKHYKGQEKDMEAALSPLKYVRKFPLLSAILVGGMTAPLILNDAPRLFLNQLWVLIGLVAYPLVRDHWEHSSRWLCDLLFGLFVLTGLTGLLFFPSMWERWALAGLQVASMLTGVLLIPKIRHLHFSYTRLIQVANVLFLVFSALALISNVFGIFTFSKGILLAGLTSMVFALVLDVMVKVIMEAAYLQGQREESGSRFSFWFKYQDFEKSTARILQVVAVISWALITVKNGALLDNILEDIMAFLNQPRLLGNMEFTWGSLLVFLLIIWVSTFLSQVIKYFFGPVKDTLSSDSKNNLANYMIIIRLLILTVGFLLAMSAAGIPLDKVAIILGALGVGIGFGLQNIVNNLVSGIILAFERPIKIGDIVELDTELGKVKEIGIRSSRIATFDGAEVIVPNGDLLSGRITNWTMSDMNRRIELIVGVGYGSDVEQVKEVILGVLKANKEVLNWPNPLILVRELSSSSVDFRVLFWTGNIDNWLSIQSDVLGTIYAEIRKAGIEIPFPKRDVKVTFQNNGSAPRPEGLPQPESEKSTTQS